MWPKLLNQCVKWGWWISDLKIWGNLTDRISVRIVIDDLTKFPKKLAARRVRSAALHHTVQPSLDITWTLHWLQSYHTCPLIDSYGTLPMVLSCLSQQTSQLGCQCTGMQYIATSQASWAGIKYILHRCWEPQNRGSKTDTQMESNDSNILTLLFWSVKIAVNLFLS